MTALTIRNIDPALKRQIKKLAAEHDRTMETEAHELLKRAAFGRASQENLALRIHDAFAKRGIASIELMPDEVPELPVHDES